MRGYGLPRRPNSMPPSRLPSVLLAVGFGLSFGGACSSIARHQAKWRALHARVNDAGMIRIKGGAYTHLGRRVQVEEFQIDETEVTVADFVTCVGQGGCRARDGKMVPSYPELCNISHGEARLSHPINCVTYRQAVEFCTWRGARLPTADEWRWVAMNRWRHTNWPWGNVKLRRPPRCNPDYDKDFRTCEVRTGDRTVDGVANMGTNAWEWAAVTPAIGEVSRAVMGLSTREVVLSERERSVENDIFVDYFKTATVGLRCARSAGSLSTASDPPGARG